MRTSYKIQTHHSGMPSLTGEFEARVTVNPNGSRYVSIPHFGCSRDYQVTDDVSAIRSLLREHATRLVRVIA
jgi:hypothetical protein